MNVDFRLTRGALWTLVGALLLVLVLGTTGCTTRIVSETGTVLNTVTSAGTGEASAAPDQAEMSFGVTKQGDDADSTLESVSLIADEITKALKDLGIDSDDLQTQNVSVWPQYDYRNNETPEITGYEASIMVRATLRDIGEIGEVITAATAAGATNVNGPQFTLSEDAESRDEAIIDAVSDARRRAEAMADAAGKTVGEVISISETGVSVPNIYWDQPRFLESAGSDSMSVPIEPGTLDISAGVTVVFELK